MSRKKTVLAPKITDSSVQSLTQQPFRWHAWIVFIIGMLAYVNTIIHDFTQDDAIVIYDNMFTTQGVKGLKGLFTKDTFFGFFKTEGKDKLVTGGRYRPLTPAMFAIEYEMAGKHPMLGHIVNILLYGLLCFLIYHTLAILLCYKKDTEEKRLLILAASLIYALHPIHTEAVANIKGRDEIMAMMGSVSALYLTLKYADTSKIRYIIFACLWLFIGLLSKENAITFLAVIPLAIYYFRDKNMVGALKYGMFMLIPAVLFLVIRGAVLGNDFGGSPMELMNNPYLKWVNNAYVPFTGEERFSTILFTLGKYIQLLFFPHPLTHDYYPRHIDIHHLSDGGVLLSFLLYITAAIYGLWSISKKTLAGFAILYFMITLSVVSNIIFPIGTNMSERFMFMPSLGFALFVGWILIELVYKKAGKNIFTGILGLMLLMYGIKTVSRNAVWESDFRLFTTDVKTSVNSAKVLNAAGGALTTEAFKEEDETKKTGMLREAIGYLTKALEIHPTYKNAYLIMGNAHYYLKEYDQAIRSYDNALRLDPDFNDAASNLAVTLRDAGRRAGEVENNLEKAMQYLSRSLSLNANDAETLRLLGVAYGIRGDHKDAVDYFERVVQLLPEHAPSYLNLANAYQNAGDLENSNKFRNKALELDPAVMQNK